MFAVNLNKTTMPIFYGKVALIESLKSIKTQILLLVSYLRWVRYIKGIFH
jgi:hypothetical protein